METKYYSEFSKQREDLRKEWNGIEWNGMNTDWEIYLQEANLRALKVSDALNVNIENYSHSEITETYNSLYNKTIEKNKSIKVNDDFSNIEEFEMEIENKGFLNLWKQFQEEGQNGLDYPDLNRWQETFKPFGLTFDYSLDAEPFDFEINYES